jgi:hypothetical protein
MLPLKASLLFILWKNGQTNDPDIEKTEDFQVLLTLQLISKNGFNSYYVTKRGYEVIVSILEKIDDMRPKVAFSVLFGSEPSDLQKKVMSP